MTRYNIIYEELQDRVDCGVLALEDAEVINDLAYERYVIEKELTDAGKEGRKRKAKLVNKIAKGIALGTSLLIIIKKLNSSKDKLKHNRLTGKALEDHQYIIKETIKKLEEIKSEVESLDTIDYKLFTNYAVKAGTMCGRISWHEKEIYKIRYQDFDNDRAYDNEYAKRKKMLEHKQKLYEKKYVDPIYNKYHNS